MSAGPLTVAVCGLIGADPRGYPLPYRLPTGQGFIHSDAVLARYLARSHRPALLGGTAGEVAASEAPEDHAALARMGPIVAQLGLYFAGLGEASWRAQIAQRDEVRAAELWVRVNRLERSAPHGNASANTPQAQGSSQSEIERRMRELVVSSGLKTAKLARVPSNYYSTPLESRRRVLGAASPHHLTKALVMENKPSESLDNDPLRYVMVLVQYTAKLDPALLNKVMKARFKALSGGAEGPKRDYALCPTGEELTGFQHNGVSPLGCKNLDKIAVVLDAKIAALKPSLFWMGGGEVDLKLAMDVNEFVAHFKAFVASVTVAGEAEDD
jgi:prolyl-tRNA editing enzyme YbaK/EbsC (Cys-tRNA(Pro) deacylase)